MAFRTSKLKLLGKNTAAIFSVTETAGVVMELLERCRNPLVTQLLVICGISLLMGDIRAVPVVGAMVLLSVVLAIPPGASLQQGRGKAQRHGANQLSGDSRRKRF
jgi:hypothetical protein